ncbi:hypothetical protein [Roseivirga sp.]|uniref:hypothetical protein n=1 Tax=Roseivirga sp. TaxID=1964215 RepID=UPI002B277445|nr:hypothetical protein [Roseivirga sp.]
MSEEKHIDPASLPLYRKGKEIFELVMKIADLIPDDDPRLQHTKQFMIQDAMMLSVKVAGASSGLGLYDLKMEAAAIIRKSARDLMVQNHALEMFDFKEAHYFDMVRGLIEEYRLLFIDWVAAFDPWDYIIDRWGLFNPPGVGPHDHDPDDDIPRE